MESLLLHVEEDCGENDIIYVPRSDSKGEKDPDKEIGRIS